MLAGMRAISSAFTVGRFGAGFGTCAGATLTAIGWGFAAVFALIAIPSLIAEGGLFLLAKLASSAPDHEMEMAELGVRAAREID